jgi:5-methylcytosine-specific restriction protein A
MCARAGISLRQSSISPPGSAVAGFLLCEAAVPSKPSVHRPPGAKNAAQVKAELDRERPSAARRGYDARWRRARAAYLARHPLCAACQAEGRVVPATVVDHVVPHRGDAALFRDQANWAALCKPCHDAKTAREGRWG